MARFPYSEEEMGDAFLRRLRSRTALPGLGRFARVFREVDCERGQPDFVGLSFSQRRPLPSGHSISGFATATVLSLLKAESPRRLEYLVAQSGFGREAVVSALRNLLGQGFIERHVEDSYTLASARELFDVDVTAFELKLCGPRRAVFQAQQYSLFAHRVVIVVPPSEVKGFRPYLPSLCRWGIGLARFDSATRRFHLSLVPQRTIPVSRQHQAYALLRLVSGGTA